MAGMKNHYSYLGSQWVNGSYCVVFILAQIQHSIYSVLLQLGKELEKSGYKLWCQTLLRLWTLYSSQNLKKGSLVLFKTRVCEKTKKTTTTWHANPRDKTAPCWIESIQESEANSPLRLSRLHQQGFQTACKALRHLPYWWERQKKWKYAVPQFR